MEATAIRFIAAWRWRMTPMLLTHYAIRHGVRMTQVEAYEHLQRLAKPMGEDERGVPLFKADD